MPRFKAGVAGPISLEDGRVVTAEQGPFDLDITTPHDQDLLDRGVIVASADPAEPESLPSPAGRQQPSSSPAGSETTSAVSGGKEG
ncbi:MAG TPA: hypothetical protein VK756_07785 [Solirubrobacteraceae bacterium]|jgi:hypothetical protein|nr:hypothetical protein [Solirubrobacteraceae bacterium]